MNYKGKTMRSIRNCLAIVACLAFGTNFAQADYDVTYSYGGGYFSFESGDIDPGLAFGHGFLAPGSGAGCKFDFWIAVDGAMLTISWQSESGKVYKCLGATSIQDGFHQIGPSVPATPPINVENIAESGLILFRIELDE